MPPAATHPPIDHQLTTLDSGLRIVTSEMPHARSVCINLFVGVGSRYESPDRAGVSHFVEHLVFKGTERRPTAKEISGVVEGVGGVLNARTEQELTVYWSKVALDHCAEAIDLLFDMLRHSVYADEEIEKERLVVFEELNMVNDFPNQKVDALIDELLWPGHPLGRDIAGTRDSVASITRDVMLDHVSRYYTPSNIIVSVAGNVPHEQIVDQVVELSQDWSPHPVPGWEPFVHSQSAPQLRSEYRSTEQAHLSIAMPGLPMVHPDRYALDLLNVILGEGMSSRLFIEVRENRGLAYDVHSDVTHFRDCGAILISAGVDPKRIYTAVDTILAEVGRLREGVPEQELEKAKRLSAGRLTLRMEDTRVVAGWMGAQELLIGEILEPDEVVRRVDRVSSGDVRRVANDLIVTSGLNMAVVGPCRGKTRLQQALVL